MRATSAHAPHRPDAKDGDRRIVTVLFADVSGFTALSERLDPEEVREFQNALFGTLSTVVERYDGFVEKYIGDAVMAVFGAPVAHEDDPERALRAALAMCEQVDALVAHPWAARLGGEVRLHVGVHSGPVVTGMLGSGAHSTYAVTGDTVNIAARLHDAAEAGDIVASGATQRLTQHAFAFEARDPLLAKGKSDPIVVYRLAGLLPRRAANRGLEAHGLRSPLIGRDEELARLRAALERARRGRTQVVSVIGEAGQGKSRLLDDFLAQISAASDGRAITIRRVHCSQPGTQTYGTIAALLREAYAIAPEDGLPTARAKLIEGTRALGSADEHLGLLEMMLGYVLGLEGAQAESLEPERLKRQIFSAMRLLVEQRLQAGVLLIAVEDVQWADPASLDLIVHLLDRLSERALMVVLTGRPGPHLHSLVPVRAEHSGIRLAPLRAEHMERMLASIFVAAVNEWPSEWRSLIVERAGGNPLYLEEIVRNMIASGLLSRTQRGWACVGQPAAIEIPATLHGLIAARLDQTPPAVRHMLQEASVLGPTFDVGLLRRVFSSATSLDALVDAAMQAEVLEDVSDADEPTRRLRFAHALLHEVAYDSLLLARRTQLHGAVACALEEALAGAPHRLEDVMALSRHYDASGARQKAAEYLLKAGEWAASIYANEDAVHCFERALRALHDCQASAAQVLAVRERLGDLFGPMGRREDAFAHYEAARVQFSTLGQPTDVARLLRKMGELHWEAGERGLALRCFHSGIELLEGRPESIERAHLYQQLGRAAFRSGDHAAAIEFAERALAHAEPLIDRGASDAREVAAAVSHAHNTLGIALARSGRVDDAIAHIERSVQVAEMHDLLRAAGRGYTNLGVLYAALDAQEGVKACSRGLDIAKRIGDFGLQSRLYANLAVAYCALTDRCEEQGIEAAQASIRLDRELEQRDHLAVPLIVLGQIHQCSGELQRARECYEEALALAEQAAEPQLLFPCYDGLATLHLDLGDEAAAEDFLERAAAVCENCGLEPDHLTVLPFLT